MSESDSTVTRSSALTCSSALSHTNDRKKRKINATTSADRTNKSHTTYFFWKDTDDNEIAYCLLCKRRISDDKKPYPYSRKGGSTSKLTTHLRDKHGITKHNYKEYLDANKEVKM